ncbi:MAG: sulfatase-like hydrolase/transferase [Bacteroidaceae bacterium]|nr:sulfatase-like hydrolase/transferase [Bacteroidaceae bacterium]
MGKRILELVKTYLLLIIVFVIQKPLFMLYNHSLYNGCTIGDYLNVMKHGLAHDTNIAAYLTCIPAVLLMVSVWSNSRAITYIKRGYFYFISLLISIIFIVNLCLYGFWGFPLESTSLFYFFSSPKEALASVSIGFVVLGLVVLIAVTIILGFIFNRLLQNNILRIKGVKECVKVTVVLFLLSGCLTFPIRGGIRLVTLNVGKVYFSTNQHLNHAAVNPVFSLVYSLQHQGNFGTQYQFMKKKEADLLFAEMVDKPVTDSIPQLFTMKRPNIVLVILESFSSHIMETMGGTPGVAVNMDRFTKEGVFFNHFYANSFRTQRALPSILSAYPAQPSTSIVKYPDKTEHLPSLFRSLQAAGYHSRYYYGGNPNFGNQRTYLMSVGLEQLITESDFHGIKKMSKWGVADGDLFKRAFEDLQHKDLKQPFFNVIQTSSSHPPFNVPYHKLNNIILNSFAYSDSCLGDFIARCKASEYWDNTIFILVPDHQASYPPGADIQIAKYHHIPLIFLGGALKKPMLIDTYASQIDIAATLLWQLGLPHNEYKFSKNILNPASPHFGYFTVPNSFGMITPENNVAFDCESNKILMDEGTKKSANLKKGKAFLQELYLDIAKK